MYQTDAWLEKGEERAADQSDSADMQGRSKRYERDSITSVIDFVPSTTSADIGSSAAHGELGAHANDLLSMGNGIFSQYLEGKGLAKEVQQTELEQNDANEEHGHYIIEAPPPEVPAFADNRVLQGEQHLVDREVPMGTSNVRKDRRKAQRAPKPVAVCVNLGVQFMVASLALIMVLQFESFNHLLRVDCMNSPEIIESNFMLRRSHEEATSMLVAEKNAIVDKLELKEEVIDDLRKVGVGCSNFRPYV